MISFVAALTLLVQVPFIDLIGNQFGNNLQSGLVAYYRFEELFGDAIDAHGSLDLTGYGTPAQTGGIVNNARRLTSAGSYYFMHTDNAAYEATTNGFTVALWVKLASIPADGTWQAIITKWNYASIGSWGLQVYTNGLNSGFQFDITNDGTTISFNAPQCEYSLEAGVWYCLVGRYSGLTGITYLDVRKVGGSWVTDFDEFPLVPFDSTAPLAIGGWAETSSTVHTPDALLASGAIFDELGFWNRMINDCERDRFYNDGLGRSFTTFDSLTCQ